jgi:mono/diheme cytochrome c family protein
MPRLLLALLLVLPARSVSAGEREDFFEARIRPILVGTCFRCHGETKTSGGLRIDSRETLLKGGETRPAVVPGKPEESLLVRAIRREEDVSAMPPVKANALRPDQVADFVAWVKAGAVWPATTAKIVAVKHWAFEPIRDVAPPEVQDKSWMKTSIDAFIRAQQEAAGSRPEPAADKLMLIRRARFDLTGLPPEPEEVAAFLQDDSPQAFETVVDRLLASPAYGERWGRHWLDVVRYADTAGETADYPVPLAWRYRNYVIDAFNADKPYDEFLREQIAGDVLAGQGSRERYAERVTATGYLAISRRFGFDSENYHHLTIQDTIDTLGQSVLGLSLGCARCHDHKFDAVSMHDYYALYGIFDSSRYPFPGSEQKQKVRSLAPLLPPSASQPMWREFDARVAALTGKLARQKQPVPASVLRSLDDIDGDFELQAAAAGGSNGVLVSPWLYEGKIAVTNAAQSPFKNLYPMGKVGVSVPAGAGEYRIDQALYPRRTRDNCSLLHVNIDFRVAAPESGAPGVHRFSIGAMRAAPAVEVLISSEAISLRMGETIESLCSLKPDQWHNLQLALDLAGRTVCGRVGMPGSTTEFSDRPFSPGWSGAIELVRFESFGETKTKHPGIEFDNLAVQETPILPVSSEPPFVVAGASEPVGAALTEPLQALTGFDEEQELNALLAEGPFAMTYGMAEGTPHDVRMHMRGEPDQPGVEVRRGFIQVLGGGPLAAESAGSGRPELAQWLTRPDNPLTARVMVNRIWKGHFGCGLVKTPNDFGVRGLAPTHPELLDHLAAQFIRSGWSVKAMHRLILLSATYQETSIPVAAQPLAEPASDSTDLYVSFPRRRLSAEEIRDSILAVSGELDPTPAREHPFPTPIHWSYTQHGPFSAVYDHNRRSVYLMTQRLKRHPFLALFDGADPNATTAERLTTTVPTQALFFLNDPFIHAKAEKWAARLLAASDSETERIELAWRRALGRSPAEIECAEAKDFLAAYRAELAAEKMDGVEGRSLSAYLRTIFGTNEFLHVD